MSSEDRIGGWVRADEHKDFQSYAHRFHLRPAAVATLLIVRELTTRRLPHLKDLYDHPTGSARERITAGPVDGRLKAEIEEQAAAAGLELGPAAAMVYR